MNDMSIDINLDGTNSCILQEGLADNSLPGHEMKLLKLRRIKERISLKREERKAKLQTKNQGAGKESYLQKVTNFLTASFFLNLAIEMIFVISLLHDHINGYFENKTYVLDGLVEGNNFCFLVFYASRSVGYFFSSAFFIDRIQNNVLYNNNQEEVGRKIITLGIILSGFSVFISTRILQSKNFYLYSVFYVAIPAFVTCTLF